MNTPQTDGPALARSAAEHELVGALFDAIDAFGGQKQSWGI